MNYSKPIPDTIITHLDNGKYIYSEWHTWNIRDMSVSAYQTFLYDNKGKIIDELSTTDNLERLIEYHKDYLVKYSDN